MRQKIRTFQRFFQGHENDYVIIGGTAAMLWMESMGEQARATKDIDLVLLATGTKDVFYEKLWDFLKAGAYKIKYKHDGTPCLYRFSHPQEPDFPDILELFAAARVEMLEGQCITPIPTAEYISNLSAIILDSEYCNLLRQGMVQVEGVSILDAYHLIPLKAKAWLNLTAEKEKGTKHIDSNDIKKHRNDILRLSQLIPPSEIRTMPPRIVRDIREFLDSQTEETFNPSQILGKGHQPSYQDAIQHIKRLYDIHD